MRTTGQENEKRSSEDERSNAGRCGWDCLQTVKRARNLARGERGSAIVETAVAIPVLMMIITAIFQFGLVFNRMISLTQGATVAAQVLQSDRLSASNDPCADTFKALTGAAPTLSSTKISISITMNGGSPITTTSCAGSQSQLAQGAPVTVEAKYPYTLSIVGINVVSGTMDTGQISEIEY